MRVPYVDLAAQHAELKGELLAAVGRVIDSGQFVLGDQVAAFEERFAALTGTSFAVGVNSGTDALILALRALSIGPGDEVITAPNSFVSSASAIAMTGATPVFVDVGDDMNIDPALIEGAVTGATRAIMPVHLTGLPADMGPIMGIAAARGLAVVEDAAQAVTAAYDGRPVGSLGDVGCFSLHPLKTLSACGDGGVLTTDDAQIAERLRSLRNLGLLTRDDAVEWSGNSRLDTMQAAMLSVKLEHLEAWTEKRRANAALYRERLAGIGQVVAPSEGPRARAVYHTFVIQADRRDELQAHLAERGVGTAVHYPRPIHLQTAARGLGYAEGSFPVSERQAGRILSLPVHQGLTEEDLGYVADQIRGFYGER
jgi:dTDP-4-amino-4,6-dideoxygalactose transaminase